MDRRLNRVHAALLTSMAVLMLSSTLSGCMSEGPGTQVFGLNESARDVIVASSHHHVAPRVLTAYTWGKIFDDYGTPSGDVTVFDLQCNVLARLPLTLTLDTIHVGPQGEIELVGPLPNVLPSGVHRAPDGGGGTLWAEAACP